ncbi:sulfite exporter TauE/SafE family protein [Dermatophilus congolensis]|uniref:sulfite exporter TauE/SafE family protein n=1 Tax=Dermatophilus congolensis TaxID=1863 RepID=UPI001AB0268F|nr:sulfite exporter TauE/SafE family protein [Dermatophilus congolensis]MBO3179391.1 sulfite exporter TauE/SafE family protein [Dermatophilus congolensis]MBO3185448.1 sulfite exporter TauE/SafE family protein [Dermatophilus congolensis]
MDWWIPPLALAVGALMGALGGGGAILTVPILTTLIGQTPRAATTGSLIIVGLSALIGVIPHLKTGRAKIADGLTFGVLGSAGALIGSHLSATVRGPVLMVAFCALLLLVAAVMIRKQIRAASTGTTRRGWIARIGAATGVGLLTGFFGVGGGFVIVPALTLIMGLEMPAAVATSLLVIAINSATSLASRATQELPLDWATLLPFAALTAFGTLLGGRLTTRINQRALNLAFIALLILLALGLAAQNLPELINQ